MTTDFFIRTGKLALGTRLRRLGEQFMEDARVNIVSLSGLGRQMDEKMQVQYVDVREAVEEVLEDTRHDLWKAMEKIEYVLSKKDFFSRICEKRKARER